MSSLINRRTLPVLLFGLAGVMLVLTFFVGWHTLAAGVQRWQYDEANTENHKGAPQPGRVNIDLQMTMLSIQTTARPSFVQDFIDGRGGGPTYDQHAGNMGSIMLGVLLMQAVVFVAFLALFLFYLVNRRNRDAAFAPIVKRLFVVFVILAACVLLYFSVSMGPAALKDEKEILKTYKFGETSYLPLEPRCSPAFWCTWTKCCSTVQNPATGQKELWQFTVESHPSAGWWLQIGGLGLAGAAVFVARRNGEFQARLEPPPPTTVANAPA